MYFMCGLVIGLLKSYLGCWYSREIMIDWVDKWVKCVIIVIYNSNMLFYFVYE